MTTSPIDRRSFGQRLARIRDKRGLGQEDLARMIGVVQGTISNWERAVENKFPGFDDAIALARALNVSLDELAGAKPTTPVPLTLDEPLFFVGADVPRLLQLRDLLDRHLADELGDPRSAAACPTVKVERLIQAQDGQTNYTRDDVRRILGRGPATIPDLGKELGKSIDTVRSAISQLVEMGEVHRISDARPIRWRLVPGGQA